MKRKGVNPRRFGRVGHPSAVPVICAVILLFSLSSAAALDVPPLRGYVNDYAAMMSPQARSRLEGELKAFEGSDSTQIVILTVPSLEGEALEEFSIKVAETWKIGQKGKDNGIILLVAARERKIRIEVGRGLEGRLTDLTAGRVVDLVIAPRFKRGDFDGGFVSGIAVLIDAVRGEFKADMKTPASRGRRGNTMSIPALLIFGGGALLVLGRLSRVLGGAAGVVGLPLIAFLLIPTIGLVTLILLGFAGLLMGVFLPGIIHGGSRVREGGGWYFGGFGGGGDFTGGGDFGGFTGGGGDFGGGGASGDW